MAGGLVASLLDVDGVVCRLGVPMMSRIIRRWTRLKVNSKSFVKVQDVQPQRIVGVTVASKSFNRDLSG